MIKTRPQHLLIVLIYTIVWYLFFLINIAGLRYPIPDLVIILPLFATTLTILRLSSAYKLNFCDKAHVDDFKHNGNILSKTVLRREIVAVNLAFP